MNCLDITTTTAYQNLQRTGYEDGGLTLQQENLLERISRHEDIKADYEVMLDDTDDTEGIQDKIDNAQGWIDYLWREYYESRGLVV